MKTKKISWIMFICSLLFNYQQIKAQCMAVGNGTNGSVQCLYPDSIRNCLFIGGGFKYSGDETINYCGFWDDSIYNPMTMNGFNGCNDSVWCYTMFNGNLYVGGSFTLAGGVTCNHIARWDGSSWFAVGNGFNHTVHSLAVYNNELYAGGEFTVSGTNSVNYIAKWNGLQWNQLAGGTNDDAETMCIWNNALYIGGDFTMAGGIIVNRICKWDGGVFSSLGNGFTIGMMGQCKIKSLCIYNGNLFASGMFDHSGTMDVQNIAMWNGSVWSSIGNIGGAMMGANIVTSMCTYSGNLFIGGNFGTCASLPANNLAMWNSSTWSNIGTGMNGMVNSLAVYHNQLYIAGLFSTATETSANNIAKYTQASGFEPIYANNNSLTVYPYPGSRNININFNLKSAGQTTFELIDLAGKVVFYKIASFPQGVSVEVVDISGFAKGSYLIRVLSKSGSETRKISIE